MIIISALLSFSAFAQNPVGCCKVNMDPNEMVNSNEFVDSCALCGEVHKGEINSLLDNFPISSPGLADKNLDPEYQKLSKALNQCQELSREFMASLKKLTGLTAQYLILTENEQYKAGDIITLERSIGVIDIYYTVAKTSAPIEPSSGTEDRECQDGSQKNQKPEQKLLADMYLNLKQVNNNYHLLVGKCDRYAKDKSSKAYQEDQRIKQRMKEVLEKFKQNE